MTAATAISVASPRPGTMAETDTWLQWWELNRARYVALDPWSVRPITRGGDGVGATNVLEELRRTAIVPAFRTALDGDPGNTLRSVLLLGLARTGDNADRGDDPLATSDLEGIFLAHLRHSNQAVSSSATISLGILGRPSALRPLAALVADDEVGRMLVARSEVPRSVRALAAYGIGLVGHQATNTDVQRFASITAVNALASVEDAATDLRVALVDTLGLIDPAARTTGSNDALAAQLLALMDDRNEDALVRAHVPRTLGLLFPHVSAESAEAIANRLVDAVASRREREPVRQGSVLALGQIGDADEDPGDARIRAILRDVVGGGNHALRTYATVALAQASSRVGDGAGDQRAGTAQTRDFLLRRLGRVKSVERTWTVLALGVLEREAVGSPSPDLRTALRESFDGQRSADLVAAHAVASGLAADGKAATPLALKMLEIDGDLRGQVALALGLTGSPAAIDPLRASLSESAHRPEVLEPTAHALSLLHDDAVVSDLLSLLIECDCLTSRSAVALALGSTRNPEAVAPLLELLQEEGALEIQRTFAAVALGRLAERQRLPWSAWITTDLNYRAATGTLSDLIRLP